MTDEDRGASDDVTGGGKNATGEVRLRASLACSGCLLAVAALVPGRGFAGVGTGQAGSVEKPSAALGADQVSGDPVATRFLRDFVDAAEANDADRKAALYAGEVDRYFLKAHVTREFVYRDVLDWLSKGRRISRFRMTLQSVSGTGDERTLVVQKQAEWMNGAEARVLANRSQFVLRRIGGEWKIVSERDFNPVRR